MAALADAKCTEGLPTACRLAGTLKAGTPCVSGLQCATGHCAFDENAACGKCAPVLATDALCEESIMAFGGGCDSGALCVPARDPERADYPVAARCIPPYADKGQSCEGAPCAPGLACRQISTNPASMTCGRPLAVGEACSEASAPCAQGTACVMGKCTAKSGEGETCFPVQYPPFVVSTNTCGDGLACAGTCKPITMGSAGESCNVNTR
ncbi:MAG TPA: hypothetical protein VLT33_43920, partial [Labilithrix sp.]|nr:hypothetical protein [Labilithrix sp.]